MRRLLPVLLVAAVACSPTANDPVSTTASSTSAPPASTSSVAPSSTLPAATTTSSVPSTTSAPTTTTTTAPVSAWRQLGRMSLARSEMPAVAMMGKILVPGGLIGSSDSSAVEAYDPSTDSWSRLADMPEPRHHHMAVAVGDVVYVIGGYGEGGFADPRASVWRYDPAADTWSDVSPLPGPRAAGGAAVVDGRIYVAGGVPDGTGALVYDPQLDEWDTLPSLTESREHNSLVALDGRLYAIAGRWGGQELASTEILDPMEGTWTPGPALNRARSGFGATVWDGSIVVVGGEDLVDLVTLTSLERLLPGGTWLEEESMPVPLHGLGLAALDDVIYVMGGSRRAGAISNSGDALAWMSPNG